MIRFKADDIIEDCLFSYYPMDVQAFLESTGSFLSQYKIGGTPFSEVLDRTANLFNINPKLILVALQREQGLISRRDAPAQRVLDRALGFGMTDSGDLKQYYGFEIQLLKATEIYRKHYDRFILGSPIMVDYGRRKLYPLTASTYSLYKYCPHIGDDTSPYFVKWGGAYGNYLTFLIWRKYWSSDLDRPDMLDNQTPTK